MMNNLGGISALELGGIVDEVCGQLANSYSIKPVRILAGAFMTSLNGPGFSITLLKVDDQTLELLDMPTEATGWSSAIRSETWSHSRDDNESKQEIPEPQFEPSNIKIQFAKAKTALTNGLYRVIRAEPDITKYDTIVGDGDCGIGLRRGAEGRLQCCMAAWNNP